MAPDGNSWSLVRIGVLNQSMIRRLDASRIFNPSKSKHSRAIDIDSVWRLSSTSMRKDDDLHDEHGNHREQPPPGMTKKRFEREMRVHMESHRLPEYINFLLATTEESQDDDHTVVPISRKAPRPSGNS